MKRTVGDVHKENVTLYSKQIGDEERLMSGGLDTELREESKYTALSGEAKQQTNVRPRHTHIWGTLR